MSDADYMKLSQMILNFGSVSEINQCFDPALSELIICNLLAIGIDEKIIEEKVEPLLHQYGNLCIQHGRSNNYENCYKAEENKYKEICEVLKSI